MSSTTKGKKPTILPRKTFLTQKKKSNSKEKRQSALKASFNTRKPLRKYKITKAKSIFSSRIQSVLNPSFKPEKPCWNKKKGNLDQRKTIIIKKQSLKKSSSPSMILSKHSLNPMILLNFKMSLEIYSIYRIQSIIRLETAWKVKTKEVFFQLPTGTLQVIL